VSTLKDVVELMNFLLDLKKLQKVFQIYQKLLVVMMMLMMKKRRRKRRRKKKKKKKL
jgi:hypothetical protein